VGGQCPALDDEAASRQPARQAVSGALVLGQHQDCLRLVPAARRLAGRPFQDGEGEVEGGACAVGAGGEDAQGAAVEFDQTPADGKAQTDAAVAAPRGALRLAKFIEDKLLFGGRNAHAAVGHRDHDLLFAGLGPQADVALLGKLHGIADQVEDHLLQPRPIAPHDRQIGRDVALPGKGLFCRHGLPEHRDLGQHLA